MCDPRIQFLDRIVPQEDAGHEREASPFTSCELQNGCNLTILPPGHPLSGFKVSATTYPEEGAWVGGSRGLRRVSSISFYSKVVTTNVVTGPRKSLLFFLSPFSTAPPMRNWCRGIHSLMFSSLLVVWLSVCQSCFNKFVRDFVNEWIWEINILLLHNLFIL